MEEYQVIWKVQEVCFNSSVKGWTTERTDMFGKLQVALCSSLCWGNGRSDIGGDLVNNKIIYTKPNTLTFSN